MANLTQKRTLLTSSTLALAAIACTSTDTVYLRELVYADAAPTVIYVTPDATQPSVLDAQRPPTRRAPYLQDASKYFTTR